MRTASGISLKTIFFLFILLHLLPGPTLAATSKLPDDLQQWIPWVLYDQEEKMCSIDTAKPDFRYCTWPTNLELDVQAKSATFIQTWLIESKSLVPLPGNLPSWPENVQDNGKDILLSMDKGYPAVWLEPGTHRITGEFSWKTLPENIHVPPATGLVRLILFGKEVQNLQLDQQGKLWFKQKKTVRKDAQESLTLQVFRKIEDGVPLIQQLLIQLTVSGNPRQITLGLENKPPFLPLELHSQLPVRLDNKGRLQIQARPGQWQIRLTLRNSAPLSPEKLGIGAIDGPWPEKEIWVFATDPKLRQIEIQDVSPIDPSRTSLPEEWRKFPAYMITANSAVKLLQKNRGNPSPVPNRLKLKRKIWLDEHGTGLTVRDNLTGTMTRGWRLNVDPSQTLGKVEVEGHSRLITKLDQSGAAGVEVRLGSLALHAESRINQAVHNGQLKIPALGWDHTFQQLSAELNLPPGWKLLTASGVDRVSTWLNQWTLLDIFLVLIIGLATSRILGLGWGTVAILLLVLSYHQPGAPRYLWLPLLGLLAIQKIITTKTGELICRIGGFAILTVLIVNAVPYMVNEIRVGIYPQLEYGRYHRIIKEQRINTTQQAESEVLKEDLVAATEADSPAKARGGYRQKAYSSLGSMAVSRKVQAIQIDPQELIQTGPGLPVWQWKTIQLFWNGPVTPDQKISFVFLSPQVNTVLAFVRTLLLTLLIGGFLRQCLAPRKKKKTVPKTVPLGLLLCCLLPLSLSAQNAQAEIPTPEILQELQNRLLRPAECGKHCVTINSCTIQIENNLLQVELQLDSMVQGAVTLPGKNRFFKTILLNQKPAEVLRLNDRGNSLIRIEAGRHTILLQKELAGRDKTSFAFPTLPKRGQALLDNWTINGLHEDGRLDKQISLSRIETAAKAENTAALDDNSFHIPDFVRIERTLHMGLKWTVSNRIIRRSPGGVIGLDIPLLPGEHVTTAGLHIKNKHVRINMGADQNSFSYFSSIAPVDSLLLTAPKNSLWTEIWLLDVSPVWHLETEGLPEINQTNPAGKRFPEYHPYPGESLKLHITRPEGVVGPTMTINRSKLTIRPGLRSTDTRLQFSLTASRGMQHSIVLPSDIDLQKSLLNGKEFPLQLENNRLIIPVYPGKQDVEIDWRSKRGIQTKLITESVDIGAKSVNASIELRVPSSRWILLAGGPQIGPAVLFWGELLVIILLALLLGRIKLTPLSTLQWLLLSLGLSQIPAPLAAVVVAWLLSLGLRKKRGKEITQIAGFNAMQVLLVLLSVAALAALFFAIQKGLLGHPDMQIGGNGSTGHTLRWYQDRSDSLLPVAWVITVPLLAYRISMLLWALWLAMALLRWLRWGWECFSDSAVWKSAPPKRKILVKKRKKAVLATKPKAALKKRVVKTVNTTKKVAQTKASDFTKE